MNPLDCPPTRLALGPAGVMMHNAFLSFHG